MIIRFSSLFKVAGFLCTVICFAQAIQAADFQVATRDDVLILTSKIQATQFLTHATFGATQAEIDQLALEIRQQGTIAAATAWMDRQMNESLTPPVLHQPTIESMVTADFPTYVLYTRTGLGSVENPYVYTPTGNAPGLYHGINLIRFRQNAWWHNVIAGQDQLRQKTAWALSQIFSVGRTAEFDSSGLEAAVTGGPSGRPRTFGVTNFYDIFVKNAFGNYRDIIKRVTFHSVMGDWLSFRGNRRAQNGLFPDENYAREVMQLFTVGLDLLSDDGVQQTDANGAIPTYDNEDIREYAKIFTGLGYAYGTYSPTGLALNPYSPYTGAVSAAPNGTIKFLVPMRMAPAEHDRGVKNLLNGQQITNVNGNGVTHTENSANAEIEAALDGLFSHPSCPPFIVHRLIQRLVKSNPSRAYIGRVVSVFKGTGPSNRGDLAKVVKAILLDPEAWQPIRVQYQRVGNKFIVSTMGSEDSRLQEPVLNYTRFLRFFKTQALYEKAQFNNYTTPILIANEFRLNTRDVEFEQSPYETPTVFNFFLAYHQPPPMNGVVTSPRIPSGLLVGPEFEIANAITMNRTSNFYRTIITAGTRTETIQTLNTTTPTSSTISSSSGAYNIVNESTRCRMLFDFTSERDLSDSTTEVDQLLERLDMYLCGGTLGTRFRDVMRTLILQEIATAGGNGNVSTTEALNIAKGAILAIFASPSFLVTE